MDPFTSEQVGEFCLCHVVELHAFVMLIYAHVSCCFNVLYIRSLCLGAARIMLSTRNRSSAASDAELTTARLSL